jgi:hypothetical protein
MKWRGSYSMQLFVYSNLTSSVCDTRAHVLDTMYSTLLNCMKVE